MPDFSLPLEYYLIPFLIIVGICLILIVVFMVGAITSLLLHYTFHYHFTITLHYQTLSASLLLGRD